MPATSKKWLILSTAAQPAHVHQQSCALLCVAVCAVRRVGGGRSLRRSGARDRGTLQRGRRGERASERRARYALAGREKGAAAQARLGLGLGGATRRSHGGELEMCEERRINGGLPLWKPPPSTAVGRRGGGGGQRGRGFCSEKRLRVGATNREGTDEKCRWVG
jgi:hypothetical protein